LHYKISILACKNRLCFANISVPTNDLSNRYVLLLCVLDIDILVDTYGEYTDGIAASVTISIINYVLLGFQFPVDGFYMHSFEIWLATTTVFFGSGNIGYTLLEYRLGHKKLVGNVSMHT
jgi:hypothetical protein